METKLRRYTEYHDSVIMKYVNKYPGNLKQAFRYAAFHLGRTVRGIEQRYYNNLYQRPYWKDIPQHKTAIPKEEVQKKEKNKLTITFGKYSISITER